jgi:hypothetical protein
VAIFWGLEYAMLTGRMIVSKAGHFNIEWKASSHRGARDASSSKEDGSEHSTGEDSDHPAAKS